MALEEQLSGQEVAASFEAGLDLRADQLRSLKVAFADAIEIVTDIDEVNRIISASDRPELAVEEIVPQVSFGWPFRKRSINNFTPNMQNFGVRVYEEQVDEWDPNTKKDVWVRTEPLNEEQLAEYRIMGGRSGWDESFIFAREVGIDESTVDFMRMHTHTKQEAFMRMWLVVPGLTERLMRDCLRINPAVEAKDDEEIFVAYAVMSRLVDVRDGCAAKYDGSPDHKALCH